MTPADPVSAPENRRRTGQSPPPPSMADLALHPVLADLTPEQQEAVLARARLYVLGRHETLFHEGDAARRFFICRRGQLKLYRLAPNGNEKMIGLVDPGSSFAEAAAFMQQRSYPVYCQALRESEVVGFDAGHFLDLLRQDPESCIRLLGILSRRLQRRVADLESHSLQNAQLRIVNYLLRLQEEGESTVNLPSSKKYIAGLLAVQPETFSRVLTALQQHDVIRVERRRIHILDQAGLVAIADGRTEL